MPKAGPAALVLLVTLALAVTAPAQEPPQEPPPAPEAAVPAEIPVEGPALPVPQETELVDVPNDGGNQIAALWRWPGETPSGITVALEVKADPALLEPYELTEAQINQLRRAREQLRSALEPLLPLRDQLAKDLAEQMEQLTLLQAELEPDREALAAARRERWRLERELLSKQRQISSLRNQFLDSAGKLADQQRSYEWLLAAIESEEYLPTNAVAAAEDLPTPAGAPETFGRAPKSADKPILIAEAIVARNPAPTALAHDEYDEPPVSKTDIPLEPGRMYVARLALTDGVTTRYYDLGAIEPQRELLRTPRLNNIVISWTFALIILSAVFLARKNPNLFIRRIAGLEAVDEAIGRATEMGKPVLYLTGMDTLSELSTLAAINILGRVARKVAEYDSDLIVPNRDPVVMTVAQEVVRAGYTDVGRPDAFKEGNIFFLTQDQFSYTAATCGIMLRDKPAANFFMGYYYAESLLLAETGQSTGAIQIAGTDSQNQLPFFITTCDYTLIGEELYAASAYLSREPLLLGSLKGLDVAKAVLILALLVQTAIFIFLPEWDYIRRLFEPL